MTLEEIPRRFKPIETIREKFICRDCEKISQPLPPFQARTRGFIGPQLLAKIGISALMNINVCREELLGFERKDLKKGD
jgi:transposase